MRTASETTARNPYGGSRNILSGISCILDQVCTFSVTFFLSVLGSSEFYSPDQYVLIHFLLDNKNDIEK